MSFARTSFLGYAAGVLIWGQLQFMVVFCFFTYGIIGQYIWAPYHVLANWPNWLLHSFLPTRQPNWVVENGWPINCLISLIGWLAVSQLVALVVYGALRLGEKRGGIPRTV